MSDTVKWHIGASGKPTRCRALMGSCPFTDYTTEDKAKAADSAEADRNRYGSFVPTRKNKAHVKDEVLLKEAVSQGDFGSFAVLSDRKKRKQEQESLKTQMQNVVGNNALYDMTVKEYKSIEQNVEQTRAKIKALKSQLQQRLQNPEWDETSAELVSMFYVYTVEAMNKKSQTKDPFEKIEAVYQEKYMFDTISQFCENAEQKYQGRVSISRPFVDKIIDMEVSHNDLAYNTKQMEARQKNQYDGFFKTKRSPEEIVHLFQTVARKNGSRHIDSMNIRIRRRDDELWGTYRNRVTLSDVNNI